jgi:tryptophan-rich sensory protein
MNRTFKFIFSIVYCQMAGIIGSVFTTPAINSWYQTINKPTWNPSNWLFAPVWITLFILMGISFYLIWTKRENEKLAKKAKTAMIIFIIQLMLNIIWSVLFFGLKNPDWAFYEIIILWIAILLTIIKFWPLSRVAGILLIPYLAWVSFASILNFTIWQLNILK